MELSLEEFRGLLKTATAHVQYEADRQAILALGPGEYIYGGWEDPAGRECPVQAAGFDFARRFVPGAFSAATYFDALMDVLDPRESVGPRAFTVTP